MSALTSPAGGDWVHHQHMLQARHVPVQTGGHAVPGRALPARSVAEHFGHMVRHQSNQKAQAAEKWGQRELQVRVELRDGRAQEMHEAC